MTATDELCRLLDEHCIAIGTAAELAEHFGVTVKTIRWWASPAAKRRDNGNCKVAERI